MAQTATRRQGHLAQGRCGRSFVHGCQRGLRRRRRRLSARSDPLRGTRAPRLERVRPRGAQHLCALFGQSWHGGTEAPIAAAHGERRIDRCDRHDGAVGRIRLAGAQDPRSSRRGSLRRQRIENLHYQWLSGGSDRLGGQDASRRGSQGDLDSSGGNPGSRGLPGGPNPRQDGPQGAGHLGAVFRERARARPPICWAGRRVRASIS